MVSSNETLPEEHGTAGRMLMEPSESTLCPEPSSAGAAHLPLLISVSQYPLFVRYKLKQMPAPFWCGQM